MSVILAVLGHNQANITLLGDAMKALGFQVEPQMGPSVQAVLADDACPELMAKIRALDDIVPVLALSCHPFDLADDSLIKPVRAFTIARHLVSMVERQGQRVGPWVFNAKSRQIKAADGQTEQLTAKESEMLDYLLRAGGWASREDILTDVFGYSAQISTHTVESHIHTLRKKLGADMLVTKDDGYQIV